MDFEIEVTGFFMALDSWPRLARESSRAPNWRANLRLHYPVPKFNVFSIGGLSYLIYRIFSCLVARLHTNGCLGW